MVILEVNREYCGRLQKVGVFTSDKDSITFFYSKEYLDSPDATAVSVSLPLQREAYPQDKYQGFFDGLVPEGRVRTELAYRFHISPSDYLGILRHLKDESIGALVFKIPEEEVVTTTRPSYRPIDNETLLKLTKLPIGVVADLAEKGRFSLAGAQAKIGIYLKSDSFSSNGLVPVQLTNCYLPEGSAPSTHILKIPDQGFTDLPVNEAFCLSAARICGLNVCESSTCLIGESKAFLTKRYDRIIEETSEFIDDLPRPLRLHQEDFCQALGLPSYRKYEMEKADNYVAIVASLLERVSENVIEDKKTFARQIIFDYLIGNCDNHIKNYSLLYSPSWNARRLAPAYDIVCTTILGYSREMGISVGDTRTIDDISFSDWTLFAEDLRIPKKVMKKLIEDVTARYEEAYGSASFSFLPGEDAVTIKKVISDTKPRLEKLKQVASVNPDSD